MEESLPYPLIENHHFFMTANQNPEQITRAKKGAILRAWCWKGAGKKATEITGWPGYGVTGEYMTEVRPVH